MEIKQHTPEQQMDQRRNQMDQRRNQKGKQLKLKEENQGKKQPDIGLNNDFLEMIPNDISNKSKNK